jgi:DNA-binding NarL/FixJ family response regulator
MSRHLPHFVIGVRMSATRRAVERRTTPERATDRKVGVVVAILAAGSEKAAAHRLGLAHSTVKHHLARARAKVGATTTAQLVWILAPRLPEPEGKARLND